MVAMLFLAKYYDIKKVKSLVDLTIRHVVGCGGGKPKKIGSHLCLMLSMRALKASSTRASLKRLPLASVFIETVLLEM